MKFFCHILSILPQIRISLHPLKPKHLHHTLFLYSRFQLLEPVLSLLLDLSVDELPLPLLWHTNCTISVHASSLIFVRDLKYFIKFLLRLGPKLSDSIQLMKRRNFFRTKLTVECNTRAGVPSWMRCKRKNSWELRDNSTTPRSPKVLRGFGASFFWSPAPEISKPNFFLNNLA